MHAYICLCTFVYVYTCLCVHIHVYLCVYMFTSTMYAYICTNVYICTNAYIHNYMYMYVDVHTYTCMYIHMCIHWCISCMCACMCLHTRVHVCVYTCIPIYMLRVHIHVFVFVNVCTYTCIPTHVHMSVWWAVAQSIVPGREHWRRGGWEGGGGGYEDHDGRNYNLCVGYVFLKTYLIVCHVSSCDDSLCDTSHVLQCGVACCNDTYSVL